MSNIDQYEHILIFRSLLCVPNPTSDTEAAGLKAPQAGRLLRRRATDLRHKMVSLGQKSISAKELIWISPSESSLACLSARASTRLAGTVASAGYMPPHCPSSAVRICIARTRRPIHDLLEAIHLLKILVTEPAESLSCRVRCQINPSSVYLTSYFSTSRLNFNLTQKNIYICILKNNLHKIRKNCYKYAF